MRQLTLLLIVLTAAITAGCGPTRTDGTQGIPAKELAILHVTQHYDVPGMQLTAIRFDDGDKFKIDGDRNFYLAPGVHPVAIDLKAKIDSPIKWVSPGETKIEGPRGLTTGDLKPGKTYELRGLADIVKSMTGGMKMEITREMATR